MVKAFAANDDVAFGDVNLSSARGIPGNHRPGEGGWPTIRYFDQKTGIAGGSYEQKTQRAICDELGDEERMMRYIEDYGQTSTCSVVNKGGCSDKEQGYIDKMKVKSTEEIESQLERLLAMDLSSMSNKLSAWVGKRKAILRGLLSNSDAAAAAKEL